MSDPADKEVQMIMGYTSPSRRNEEAPSQPNSASADNASNRQQFINNLRDKLKNIGRTSSRGVTSPSRLADRFKGLGFSTKNRQGTGTEERRKKLQSKSAKRRNNKIRSNRTKQRDNGLHSNLGQPKIW